MMKYPILLLAGLSLSASAYGLDDATKAIETIREDYDRVETTYKREGLEILRIIETPGRDFLRQTIMLGDVKIAELFNRRGEEVHVVQANIPVSVAFTYSAEGELAQVELAQEGFYGLEIFSVESGRLTPVPGEQLKQYREFASDLQTLFDRDSMKEMTNQEFVQKALETALRHRERAQQTSDGNAENPPGVEREP